IGGKEEEAKYGVTNKIAVRCKYQEDWDYVCKTLGFDKSVNQLNAGSISYRLIYLDFKEGNYASWDYEGLNRELELIITIDDFKRFYPEEPNLSLPIVDNSNVDNIIEVLKVQT